MSKTIITPWGEEMDEFNYKMLQQAEEEDRLWEKAHNPQTESEEDEDDENLDSDPDPYQGFGPDDYEVTMGIRDETDDPDCFDSTAFYDYD